MSGLMGYMQKNPSIYRKVEITNVIKDYRKATNQKPLLVIDGNCSRNFFLEPNPKKYLTGGQFKLYKQKVDEFIDFFENLNVKLVIFFHGCPINEKDLMNNTKDYIKDKKWYACHKVLDAIDNNEQWQIKHWEIQLPCYIVVAIKSAFQERCTVLMSTFQTCNAEIRHYANTNNAMAVISQDSDFATSLGSWQFWSIKDINYNEKTVYIYHKESLAKALRLRVDQLPLFRTMLGNNYVYAGTLENWFQSLGVRRRYGFYDALDKILKVSNFIKNNPDMSLEQISWRAFQKDNSDLVRRSIEAYQGVEEKLPEILSEDKEWDKVLKVALKQMLDSKVSPGIFGFMRSLRFGVNSGWEDFRKNDIIQADEIWQPLRAKIYGILLHDYPHDKTVTEWICTTSETIRISSTVQPTPPACDLQGHKLVDFWAECKDDAVIDISWNLFHKSLNENLPLDRVQSLDKRLLSGVMVLLHMIKPCKLSENEIKAFLLVNVLCSTKDDVSELTGENIRINTRALRLSTVFLKGIHRIRMLSATLNFVLSRHYVAIWNIFDGALLHDFFDFSNGKMKVYEENKLFIEGKGFIDNFQNLF